MENPILYIQLFTDVGKAFINVRFLVRKKLIFLARLEGKNDTIFMQ